MSWLPCAQLKTQTLCVLLKHGLFATLQTMKYFFRTILSLDLTEIDMVVALLCTFIIVLDTMYYCVVLLG